MATKFYLECDDSVIRSTFVLHSSLLLRKSMLHVHAVILFSPENNYFKGEVTNGLAITCTLHPGSTILAEKHTSLDNCQTEQSEVTTSMAI